MSVVALPPSRVARRVDAVWPWAAAAILAVMAWRYWLVPHLGITLFIDEAQYWHWSRALAFGYYSKPPVIAALIAASTAIAGDGVLGVKWLVMLCYPLAALVLARLAFEMAGGHERPLAARAALWALALAMTAPAFGLLGLFATTDGPLLLAWAIAAWALWRALEANRPRDWALLGAALAFGLLSKYTMAAFAATLVIALCQARALHPVRERAAGLAIAAAIVLVALAPHLAWNAAHGWPTWRHTAEITTEAARASGSSALQSWAEFSLAQLVMLGPWAVAAIVCAWRRRDRSAAAAPEGGRDDRAKRACHFAVALAWPLLAIGMLQALHARAQINWCAPALLGVLLWLALHADRLGGRMLAAIVASNLALTALVAHAPDLARLAGRPLPHALDAWSRMRGWDAAFERLRPAAAALTAAQGASTLIGTDREVLAFAAYHWRDLPLDKVAWNPQHRLDDHYRLTTRMPQTHATMLLISQSADADGALAAFASVTPLGAVEQRAGERRSVRLYLWRVQDARGAG